MTKSRIYHCDFCSDTSPIQLWRCAQGETVNLYGIDAAGGVHKAISDNDGLWGACQVCHDTILKFKAAKVFKEKRLILRQMLDQVAERADWQGRFGHKGPYAIKGVRQQTEALYKDLLPSLVDFVPWIAPHEKEKVRAIMASKRLRSRPTTPDGQSRALSSHNWTPKE